MHLFVPNLGQGACYVIEDAWVITAGLAKGLRGDDRNFWVKTHRQAKVEYIRRTANMLGHLTQSKSAFM